MYTIKEVAQLLHMNANALRFYERKALISPSRLENGYRMYSDHDVAQIQQVLIYRQMGFSIEDIHGLLKNEAEGSLVKRFAKQYTLLNDHLHAMTKIRETLGLVLNDLLNGSSEDLGVAAMTQTSLSIKQMNQWKDRWNFDSWAQKYDLAIRRHTGGLDFYRHYDQVLSKVVEGACGEKVASEASGMSVLEIGIGTGNLARLMLDTQAIGPYIGVDQSFEMLQLAKAKCPALEVRQGTFLKLPVKDHSVDCVVTSYAFHHCSDEEKGLAIKEMKRVLKLGGQVLIADLMFENSHAEALFRAQCSEDERIDLDDEYFARVDHLNALFEAEGMIAKAQQVDNLIWIVSAQ